MKKRIDAETVRLEYHDNKLTRKEIADKYHVTISCINSIIRRNDFHRTESKPPVIKIGAIFGILEIKNLFTKESGNQIRKFASCLCRCGNEKDIPAYNLQKGITKTCGCDSSPMGKFSKKWMGCGEISAHYWREIVNRAERHHSYLEFDIDLEYIWELFLKQDGRCALTGLKLKFKKKTNGKDGTASLDRIDSSKGYIKGNVQWIHKHVNKIKLNFNENYFIAFCNLISKNHPLTTEESQVIIETQPSGMLWDLGENNDESTVLGNQ